MINLGILNIYTGPNNPYIFKRTAVRGIIKREEKFLFVESMKYHDVKFPGGGLEKNESQIEALEREIREETGYELILESVKEYAWIKEYRNVQEENSMLDMTNYYYVCEVGTLKDRALDDYEQEYDYQVVFLTLDEAIEKNEGVLKEKMTPWVKRELTVLKYIKKEGIL
ncbi:MAG: NUDIX domain-containing protein [Bacilli bacterium]|nr:NUDIX domain-containing protein [Bacilli bacterium]